MRTIFAIILFISPFALTIWLITCGFNPIICITIGIVLFSFVLWGFRGNQTNNTTLTSINNDIIVISSTNNYESDTQSNYRYHSNNEYDDHYDQYRSYNEFDNNSLSDSSSSDCSSSDFGEFNCNED